MGKEDRKAFTMDLWPAAEGKGEGEADVRKNESKCSKRERYGGNSEMNSNVQAMLQSQSAELSWGLEVCNLLLPFACERSACLKGEGGGWSEIRVGP